MSPSLLGQVSADVQEVFASVFGADVSAHVARSGQPHFGHFQANGCLALAKAQKQPPRALAERVVKAVEESNFSWFERAEVAGPGFINLWVKQGHFFAAGLAHETWKPAATAASVRPVGSRVVIDYSGPNIAKRMHVGHLRTTVIGESLKRLLRYVGCEVLADNHIGDWGTNFGLLLAQAERESLSSTQVAELSLEALEGLYQRARRTAAEDEVFAARARAFLSQLHQGQSDALEVWSALCAATRKEVDGIYALLGVSFDMWRGESFYRDRLGSVVEGLLAEGLAREDDGAVAVFFDEIADRLGGDAAPKAPFIVRKRDGAFLYSTSDIATLVSRHEELAADEVLYVVDARQSLHFQQLFALGKALGLEARCTHVSFGSVLGADGTPLKTRAGDLMPLLALLESATDKALERMTEQGIALDDEASAEVAKAVGIGAVIYADLRQHRGSDYRFDLDKLISFQGNSGPYLQYAYARIASMLRQVEAERPSESLLEEWDIERAEVTEVELAMALSAFPDAVAAAANALEPHLLAEHLHTTARGFSAFYAECTVLGSEGAVRERRLALCRATARALATGLELLGLSVVERM